MLYILCLLSSTDSDFNSLMLTLPLDYIHIQPSEANHKPLSCFTEPGLDVVPAAQGTDAAPPSEDPPAEVLPIPTHITATQGVSGSLGHRHQKLLSLLSLQNRVMYVKEMRSQKGNARWSSDGDTVGHACAPDFGFFDLFLHV